MTDPSPTAKAAAALAAAIALISAAQAHAAAGPQILGPLYQEPTADKPATDKAAADKPAATKASAPAAPACPITVVSLTDTRRAPDILGMEMQFRALGAPADRQAWLRSIVETGLTARGFTPTVSPEGAPAPAADTLTLSLSLKAAWISLPTMNKSASVVLRAGAGRGVPGLARDYRGDVTNLNWAGTTNEFNSLLNRTIAQALDDLAADLRPMCASPAASPSPAEADKPTSTPSPTSTSTSTSGGS